ncbi:GTP 3',8-cyclase [Geodia barretti]|uniref:GTP 3',8-cyclase n=1 Tax=Geodia barretti TaxID=519541 RepID=A0AA35X2W9_GEOBA|nr:GTP 3',8-cyclase [Geodia barretti]
MPAEIFGERYEFLKREEILSFEEITRLTRLFVGFGVRKVRITGGEPLVRAQVTELIARLAEIDGVDDLAMTTNGFLLPRYAHELKDAGLNRLTVSMDALDEDVFSQMSGRPYGPEKVLAGIDAARDAGFSPLKINTVVQRGVNEQTILETAEHFRGTGDIVRFIEFMDVGNLNDWDLSQVVSGREIIEIIDAEYPLEPADANYQGEVASRYRYVDGQGEIGVITSVTQPFCGDCTRARLTTEGRLVTCLFATRGTDLKEPDELNEIIEGVWLNRRDRYSETRSSNTALEGAGTGAIREKIEMFRLGG